MSKFTIGRSESGRVDVDMLRLVDTRMLVCANSGGGKSWLLRLIAERAASKVQTIILDPEGEFGTLREKLDILIAGEGGEVPVDVRSAGLLARRLAELRVSAVINLYDIEDGWEGRRRYCGLFLDALMSLPKTLYHPMFIILDEAHRFCPESEGKVSRDDPVSLSRRAVNNMMSAGRKRGIAGLLATQRVSKLHKDAIAECRNVFIGNTVLDLDQQRSGDMLGFSKADRLALRDLEPGEFYAFGPAMTTKGIVRFRSDQVETTHPKPGQRHSLEVPQASGTIAGILDQLKDLPAQAIEETRTLETLRRRNSELERELRMRPVQVQPEVRVERVDVPVITNGTLEKLETVAGMLRSGIGEMTQAIASLDSVLQRALAVRSNAQAALVARPEMRRVPVPSASSRRVDIVEAGLQERLQRAERGILTVLAQYPAGKSKIEIAVIAGYRHNGGGFNNAIGRCRSQGWIAGDKERFTLTDAGVAALGEWEPLPTGHALADYWKQHLPKAERAILSVLMRSYPHAIDDETLAREARYTAGTGGYNNAKSRLKTLELMEMVTEDVGSMKVRMFRMSEKLLG